MDLDKKSEFLKQIEAINIFALDKGWPKYMKFRPVAILSLIESDPKYLKFNINVLLDLVENPFWPCRYATLMGASIYLNSGEKKLIKIIRDCSQKDPNRFVRIKAKKILKLLPLSSTN